MYISSIEIKNYGPIENTSIELPFNGDRPKPLLLIGQNGSGKSLLLANIVNALISGRQTVFDDNEVEKGKVYKYRMPGYITSGKDFTHIKISFHSGVTVEEIQLSNKKSALEKKEGEHNFLDIFKKMPPNQASSFESNFDTNDEVANQLFNRQCALFFPVHRHEEPAWLNIENATKKPSPLKLKSISRYSNRQLVSTSPLEENRSWLLDLLLDRSLFEIDAPVIPIPIEGQEEQLSIPIFRGFSGRSSGVYEAVLKLVRIILRKGEEIRFGVGERKNRQISIMMHDEVWIPNIFQLSTGEIQLLNLFLSIIRDYDLSESEISDISDIKGIVIIDEIDIHLHTSQQITVLPELISAFPNVQFIITTHSPLFLIGLEKKIGRDGFLALQMPTAAKVSIEEFSEFGDAYEVFRQTERHKSEIKNSIIENQKPILFMEGDYDLRYITKAAALLGKEDILDRIIIKDGGGSGNLDKIWRGYDNPTNNVLSQRLILLYDCDTGKPNQSKGQIFKRTIPTIPENPISIGIENLFTEKTINKIEEQNPQFIDLQGGLVKRIRNIETTLPPTKTVNKDEKGNMCNWICQSGTKEDFLAFIKIFEIIEEVINLPN